MAAVRCVACGCAARCDDAWSQRNLSVRVQAQAKAENSPARWDVDKLVDAVDNMVRLPDACLYS